MDQVIEPDASLWKRRSMAPAAMAVTDSRCSGHLGAGDTKVPSAESQPSTNWLWFPPSPDPIGCIAPSSRGSPTAPLLRGHHEDRRPQSHTGRRLHCLTVGVTNCLGAEGGLPSERHHPQYGSLIVSPKWDSHSVSRTEQAGPKGNDHYLQSCPA